MRKILIIVILTHTFLAGQTWIVDAAGNGDFTDIQNAINNATDGDTIYVMNGTYTAFGVPQIDISILGESNDSTRVIADGGLTYISTNKRCEINNIRFAKDLNEGIFVDSYLFYKFTHIIPELIIENCVFDGLNESGLTIGVTIGFDYHTMNTNNVIDTFLSRIKINNNLFKGVNHAVEFFSNSVLLEKRNFHSTNFSPIVINCNDNFYNVFDSIGIDTLVYDSRDPLDSVYINLNHGNLAYFDYIPWSDTLITKKYNSNAGILYNNFIDCNTVFYSGVIEDTSTALEKEPSTISNYFSLLKTYPNPFNNKTVVQFNLPAKRQVTFSIYDINGKAIPKLSKTKTFFPGINKNAFNFDGLTSGIYVIKIKAGEWSKSTKVMYLK